MEFSYCEFGKYGTLLSLGFGLGKNFVKLTFLLFFFFRKAIKLKELRAAGAGFHVLEEISRPVSYSLFHSVEI